MRKLFGLVLAAFSAGLLMGIGWPSVIPLDRWLWSRGFSDESGLLLQFAIAVACGFGAFRLLHRRPR